MNRRTFLQSSLAFASTFAMSPIRAAAEPVSDEFAALDGLALAELVRTRQVTPLELVEATIRRMDRLDPKINAVVIRLDDRAISRSKGKLPDGVFKGVPTLVKDMEPIRFARHTFGSVYFKNFVSPVSCEFIDRIDRSGAITLGKTNLPEFGLMPCTEPRLFGPTNNPWNLAYSPGGSSGGSAAAVAAGIVPFAQGGDGGGSIRIPASCCGIFGMKVSRGRNPVGGSSIGVEFSTRHCLSRSVRDSAAFLDATQGALMGDRFTLPGPDRPFLEEVTTPPGTLRIGMITSDMLGRKAHPECLKAVDEAAKLCESLGHSVEPTNWPIRGGQYMDALRLVFSALAASAVMMIERLFRAAPSEEALEPLTWWLVNEGKKNDAASYASAWGVLDDGAIAIARHFQRFDVLLTPVMNRPPFKTGEIKEVDSIDKVIDLVSQYIAYTIPVNATGQPAMSVPMIRNDDGLPIGAQFIGRFADEATLFRLAGQIEQARPWALEFPAIL